MHKSITSLHAYKAMICLLDNYYNETLSDDLGSLLGDLQILDDGNPCDPATWTDWMNALSNNQSITTSDAFKAVIKFLDAYSERTSSSEIKDILYNFRQADLEKSNHVVWNNWIRCVHKQIIEPDYF